MNEIDRLVRQLYSADAPPPPAPVALWTSVEGRIGAPARSSPIRRRRRLALAFGLALAGAAVLAILPALRHSPGEAIPESASAAQVLRTLAERGSSLPDVPRGSFLYSSGTRIVLFGAPNDDGISFSAFIRQHWELWVGRDGSVRQRVRTDRAFAGYPSRRDRLLAHRYTGPIGFPEDTITRSPAVFRREFGMTLSTMRRLPTEASALARAVLANPNAHARHDTGWGLDDPFQAAIVILKTPVRPATRAAMLRALATLPHVRRLPDESVAGRRAVTVALRFVLPGSRRNVWDHVILLDPTTGALRAARYVSRSDSEGVPAGTVISRWTYRQAIVPTLRRGPEGS